jgi:hypothetical protein
MESLHPSEARRAFASGEKLSLKHVGLHSDWPPGRYGGLEAHQIAAESLALRGTERQRISFEYISIGESQIGKLTSKYWELASSSLHALSAGENGGALLVDGRVERLTMQRCALSQARLDRVCISDSKIDLDLDDVVVEAGDFSNTVFQGTWKHARFSSCRFKGCSFEGVQPIGTSILSTCTLESVTMPSTDCVVASGDLFRALSREANELDLSVESRVQTERLAMTYALLKHPVLWVDVSWLNSIERGDERDVVWRALQALACGR